MGILIPVDHMLPVPNWKSGFLFGKRKESGLGLLLKTQAQMFLYDKLGDLKLSQLNCILSGKKKSE